MEYSLLIIVLALLVVVTNIIVQVIKNVSGIKERPTRIVATIVAVLLTMLSFEAYCEINGIVVTWYHIVASFIVGIIVAYGSIFGFDNLYGEFLDKLKNLITKK